MDALLSPTDTAADLVDTAFVHRDESLHASYSTGDFAGAVRLLDRVAEVADAMDHHPDVTVGYGAIAFELSSHDAGGVTQRDVALALRIQELADRVGATSANR